jgi:hypothetical protein
VKACAGTGEKSAKKDESEANVKELTVRRGVSRCSL